MGVSSGYKKNFQTTWHTKFGSPAGAWNDGCLQAREVFRGACVVYLPRGEISQMCIKGAALGAALGRPGRVRFLLWGLWAGAWMASRRPATRRRPAGAAPSDNAQGGKRSAADLLGMSVTPTSGKIARNGCQGVRKNFYAYEDFVKGKAGLGAKSICTIGFKEAKMRHLNFSATLTAPPLPVRGGLAFEVSEASSGNKGMQELLGNRINNVAASHAMLLHFSAKGRENCPKRDDDAFLHFDRLMIDGLEHDPGAEDWLDDVDGSAAEDLGDPAEGGGLARLAATLRQGWSLRGIFTRPKDGSAWIGRCWGNTFRQLGRWCGSWRGRRQPNCQFAGKAEECAGGGGERWGGQGGSGGGGGSKGRSFGQRGRLRAWAFIGPGCAGQACGQCWG